jgi:hypothetical protein
LSLQLNEKSYHLYNKSIFAFCKTLKSKGIMERHRYTICRICLKSDPHELELIEANKKIGNKVFEYNDHEDRRTYWVIQIASDLDYKAPDAVFKQVTSGTYIIKDKDIYKVS